MKRPLLRLLRMRELVEDLARREMEGKGAAMRLLEEAAEQQRQMARSTRALAIEDLAGEGMQGGEAWQLKIADAELAQWTEMRLKAFAEAARPGVERAREELLERRMERRQAEILHTAAVQREEKSRVRDDQNRTDDRFQSRSARRKSDAKIRRVSDWPKGNG